MEPANLAIVEGTANLAIRLGRHRQAVEQLRVVVDAKPERDDLQRLLAQEERRLTEELARDPLATP